MNRQRRSGKLGTSCYLTKWLTVLNATLLPHLSLNTASSALSDHSYTGLLHTAVIISGKPGKMFQKCRYSGEKHGEIQEKFQKHEKKTRKFWETPSGKPIHLSHFFPFLNIIF